MMFDLKHRRPYYRLLLDTTTDNDHFLTCINSRHNKAQRIETQTKILDRFHPRPLHNFIIHHVDNYYMNMNVIYYFIVYVELHYVNAKSLPLVKIIYSGPP